MEAGDIVRWIYGRLFGRPMSFSFIDDDVAGSASPMRKKEVDWLRERKQIRAILSVREFPLASHWIEGLGYLNVPVQNHHAPTMEQLKQCVDFIVDEADSGKKIVVHCAAGKGRTGTVLAAYICRKQNLAADESIKLIRQKRHGSIERSQEAAVREYCSSIQNTK